jgi:hypothetical protein
MEVCTLLGQTIDVRVFSDRDVHGNRDRPQPQSSAKIKTIFGRSLAKTERHERKKNRENIFFMKNNYNVKMVKTIY